MQNNKTRSQALNEALKQPNGARFDHQDRKLNKLLSLYPENVE
jgi:hypothetical protein